MQFCIIAFVTTLAKRATEARLTSGKGFNDIDREIGQNPGWTSKLCSGKTKRPTAELLIKFAHAANVRVEWLVLGEPPMRHEGTLSDAFSVAAAAAVLDGATAVDIAAGARELEDGFTWKDAHQEILLQKRTRERAASGSNASTKPAKALGPTRPPLRLVAKSADQPASPGEQLEAAAKEFNKPRKKGRPAASDEKS